MERKIKVVLKKPNEKALVTEINNEYEQFAELVDGLIDMTEHPIIEDVDVILNDMSLMNGMSPNIVVREWESVFAGPLIFAGYDPETGNTISLTDKQIGKVLNYINRNQVFNMSLDMAYLYSKVICPFEQCEDALKNGGGK